jgi:hypothetical protein
MKIIDRSPYLTRPDRMSIFDRVLGSMKHGLNWPAEVEAQQTCVNYLGKALGDDYTLLLNVSLGDLEIPISMVLVGPAGLFVLLVTTLIGSFRAKEENWLSLENPRSPKPAQPNLLLRACLMSQAVDVYLATKAVPAPRAQPVLLCANPHMFVECARPMARVISGDTIELFAASLMKDTPVTNPQVTGEIVEAMAPPPAAGTTGERLPESRLNPSALEAKETDAPRPERRLKFNFTRGQLIALGVMIIFEVIFLVIIIILTFRSLLL